MNLFSYLAQYLGAIGLAAAASVAPCGPLAAQGYPALAARPLDDRTSPRTVPASSTATAAAGWKAVLVGGNHLVDSHNNAASDLADRLRGNGVQLVTVLRSTGPGAGDGVSAARRRELRQALQAPGADAACLFFITSHANERGIYLSADKGYLSPRELSRMIDAECGARPTVLILSGCGTGAFITPELTGDNRIILAASARGRVSYGGGTTDRYVNFDRCMIGAIDAGARTWREVFDTTLPCVGARETSLGVAASQPQAWFGPLVAHLTLPGRL